jgi:hypothetical protein
MVDRPHPLQQIAKDHVMAVSGSVALLSGLLAGALALTSISPVLARSGGLGLAHPAFPSTYQAMPTTSQPAKDLIIMAADKRSSTGVAEMAAAKALTTKIVAIGSWTAKATPESRPAIMPFEARDTLRLQLAGKIDQWFAKTDGSGAVFLMNVTDPAEAHRLLEELPLGQADMMTFELIPVGPLWPLGLLLPEPAK